MINWNNIKDRFTHLFIYLSRAVFVLPIILYFYLIGCLLIKDSEFFYNNAELMNWLDTPFFILMCMHFVKNYSKYSKFAQNCAWCVACVLLIKAQEIGKELPNENYYNMFWILIVLTALFSVWDNLNYRFIKKK